MSMRPPRARYFNTTGPCGPQHHYMLPPTPRLPEARALIEMDRYFVLHAPRQTGKTTILDTLASELTAEGDLAALSFSCERAKTAGDDIAAADDSAGLPSRGRRPVRMAGRTAAAGPLATEPSAHPVR